MPRLGDETWDVPCITGPGVENPEAMREDAKTALEWCSEYIEANDVPVTVRIVWNAHEFGSYPSIEVDYGDDMKHETYYVDDVEVDCSNAVDCIECEKVDKAHEKKNAMDKAFSEHFKQWL